MQIAKLMSSKKSPLPKELQNSTPKNNNSTPTIVAKDLLIEGDLKSSGLIEVEGKINGTIKSVSVVIRESGFVDGTIIAQNLIIKGEFNGNISAKNVNITNKGKVIGSIEYDTLSVEDGASIDGQFKKLSPNKTDS